MKKIFTAIAMIAAPLAGFASEADLKMPDGFADQAQILMWGFAVVLLGVIFGFWQFTKVHKLPAHESMLEIGNVIFQTCSTYLKQQGKFLCVLFVFIGASIALYFGVLSHMSLGSVLLILGLDNHWYTWQLRCGLVWRPHEYICKCTYGIRFFAP